jgi:DNA repair protein RadA/Sms
MMSSFLDSPVDHDVVMFGEVGLTGEVRGVSQPALRIREAEKLGFSTCILPQSNTEAPNRAERMKRVGVASIRELYEHLFAD